MFANVIMPEVTVNEMRGLMVLLQLIGNGQSQQAADLLAKLSAEKDAAVEAAKQAASDRLETERLARELTGMQAREASLAEGQRQLSAERADLDRRAVDFDARLKAIRAAAALIRT
jgi:hypothetical protein